ncbi:MAG: hypothetical protein D6729_18720 [Deltaproteobacteria bacterium]|nr:MAG: hypothetical protein D6729_18720 [Deltaproteobacteria bacterium]
MPSSTAAGSSALDEALRKRIGRAMGVPVARMDGVSGGCIAQAFHVRLQDGRSVFAKWRADAPPGLFVEEARGLREIAETPGAPKVPEPLYADETLLVLEYLPPGQLDREGWAALGRALAAMHQRTAPRFGFHADNYIGATPQPNPWTEDGITFFAEHRLRHQLRLARDRGLLDGPLVRDLEALIARLPELLPSGEAPALVHGDLWSGNVYAGHGGLGCLVDPAAHYGLRETDLAMTKMFGRLPDAFYRGYEEAWPLPPGAETRVDLLNLYHQLNHLNLFGSAYLGGVVTTVRSYT